MCWRLEALIKPFNAKNTNTINIQGERWSMQLLVIGGGEPLLNSPKKGRTMVRVFQYQPRHKEF